MTGPLDGLPLDFAPAAHAPHAVSFIQARAAVTLQTDWPTVYAHARDTLYSYRRAPHGPAPRRVRIASSPDLDPDTLNAAFDSAPEQEIGPLLHARVLPVDRGRERAYWVAAHDTLIRATAEGASVVAHCRTERAALHWGFRLVRQAMTAQLLADGAVYAHCAAFTHCGRGVLIAGHRGRGKTTTLLAALRYLGGDFVTNDRLLLELRDNTVVGHPWPSDLRAGVGTLSALPNLAHLVPAEARGLPEGERWRYRPKVSIEPADFGQLAPGGTVDDTVWPEVMLWPHLEPGRSDAVVERIATPAAARVLTDTRIFMTDPAGGADTPVNHWLWPPPPDDVMRRTIAVVADHLAQVPCYRIRSGGDPRHLAHRIAALLGVAPPGR